MLRIERIGQRAAASMAALALVALLSGAASSTIFTTQRAQKDPAVAEQEARDTLQRDGLKALECIDKPWMMGCHRPATTIEKILDELQRFRQEQKR